MFKYKNISDFRQSMVLDGKRILLKPDDVIESSTEIRSAFLEPVDSETPVNNVFEFKKTENADPLSQEVKELKAIVNTLKETYEKDKVLIARKLEMLKSAVMTVENQVFSEEEPKKK